MKTFAAAVALSVAAIACAGRPVRAAEPAPVTIVVFNPPSLGAMFPAVIKQQKFDLANGIDITFVERPPDAYAAEFNTGEFQVGGSASVLILGLGATRGIKTSYLFNLFDYWGTVVTSRPDIKTLADLAGKQLAAAKGTTNYTMFAWLAKQQGVDPELPAGRQYRDARPGRLRARRSRRCRAALGAGLYAGQSRAPGNPHHRSQYRESVARVRRRQHAALSRRRRASGMDRCASRSHSRPLSRLQTGRRLGLGQSGRGGAAGRDGQGRRRAAGDRRADCTTIRGLRSICSRPARSQRKSRRTYRAGIDVGLFKAMPPASSIYTGEME